MSGRKTNLTTELTKQICADLERAVPFKYACGAVGIGSATAYEWMRKGRAGNRRYAAFVKAVEVAQAKAVCDLHAKLLKASKGDAKGIMFLLERLYPSIYGPNVAPAPEERGPLQIVMRRLDPVVVPTDMYGRAISQN
ncbi:MAG TPA: hypothetical protein VGF98_04990 [Candidatus Tumulicola sp.]